MSLDVRAARERNGWSRKQLAELLRWPVSRVWAVETQKRPATPDELVALAAVLGPSTRSVEVADETSSPSANGDDDDPKRLGEARVHRDTPVGATRATEWNGLRYGDVVKLSGERGTFIFRFHHVDDHQEYVEIVGGSGQHQFRSVRPERLRDKRGRRLPVRCRNRAVMSRRGRRELTYSS